MKSKDFEKTSTGWVLAHPIRAVATKEEHALLDEIEEYKRQICELVSAGQEMVRLYLTGRSVRPGITDWIKALEGVTNGLA